MLALTFPGQGSQKPGMGAPWRDTPSWSLVEHASDAVGRDVGELLIDADAETLRDTRNAQLTTFVTSLVVFDALQSAGLGDVAAFAGHSLGEYTALTAAGAMKFADGAKLVAARAAAMHEAGAEFPGTMAAVLGLDDDAVEAACADVDDDVWVANYNAPGQVVIAGSEAGIEAAGAAAKARGAKRILGLAVAGAFHTPFMQPAAERLQEALTSTPMSDTTVPVVSNVDAAAHHEASRFAELLAIQLVSPVRWSQGLRTIAGLGVTGLVEAGPGAVLTGMAKRTLDGVATISIATPDDVAGIGDWITTTTSG